MGMIDAVRRAIQAKRDQRRTREEAENRDIDDFLCAMRVTLDETTERLE
jgi:hypothetical protein